jgi:beta-glucosidase
MTKKRAFLISHSFFITALMAFLPTEMKAFDLSTPLATINNSVKNTHITIQKQKKFAKAMAQAFIRYFWNNQEHTDIEKKLAHLYQSAAVTPEAMQAEIEALAEELYRAIINNPSISIDPQEFLLGASSSAYQIEGGLDETSAAARFYRDKAHLGTAGDAIDFYHHYDSDIQQLAEELHINAYRLSIAWDRIQPAPGIFDREAIEFYQDVLRNFLARGIRPLVTFHHYDVPQWFEDMGGFELAENGKYFQEFCLKMYTELAPELGHSLISMCNAPEGPAFKGYFTGEGTPGEKNNIQKTHTVIANMYYEMVDSALAIQRLYKKLHKDNPLLQRPQIGIQINVVPIDPHPGSNDFPTALACAIGSYVQSGGTYDFLVNGIYCMYTPNAGFMKTVKGLNVYREHKHAHRAFDWIGVNIYSNRFMKGFDQIVGDELIETDEERYTDNPNYRNYPEGIYRAVKMISEHIAAPLGKIRNKNGKPLPVIVTENGIATNDDAKRTRYFQRALKTITQLVKEGYPVIGYLPWASHDNYEWPTENTPIGFGEKNYGFFAVNFDKNSSCYLARTLKEGSHYYAHFAQKFFA